MQDVLAVLRKYSGDFRSTSIEPLGSAGGMSGAQFWRVRAPSGAICLRRWPKEHPSLERLAFIHSVLRHAESRGIEFVPVPVRAADGESFVQHDGYLWELSPWRPGTADYEQSPSDGKLRAAMSALARFDIATCDYSLSQVTPSRQTPQVHESLGMRSNALRERYRRLQELLGRDANKLLQAIDDTIWPELAPLALQFLATLPAALPPVTALLGPLQGVALPLQPCIRDIWHDHVLFSGEEVTGFVDFGAVDIDTPACDVARLLGSLVGDDASGWQKGLAAYSAVRPLSAEETNAVRALDVSGTLLAGCNWIRWIYIEGREFENRQQVVERFRRILFRTQNLPAHGHWSHRA